MADSSNCPWTITDQYGNKLDAHRAGLTDDKGCTFTIGPSRHVPGHVPGKDEISWSRAERMLRRGKAHLSLDVPGLGQVRFETPQGEWEGVLAKGRKTSTYQWGCPDVKVLKATGWKEPSAAEREAVADAMLLSTLARVRSGASENAGHARSVIETAVGRMLSGSPLLRTHPGAKDNKVVRHIVAEGLLNGEGRPLLSGKGDERSALKALSDAGYRPSRELGMGRALEDPAVLRKIVEEYPNLPLPAAVLLAAGLMSDSEAWNESVFTITKELRRDMDEKRRAREEMTGVSGAYVHALSAMREGREEPTERALGPETLRGATERLEFRRQALLPDLEYETMPGIFDAVQAAVAAISSGRVSDTKAARDALYHLETLRPGALLWAAAHSGDRDLQEMAIASLPSRADIEYVLTRAEPDSHARRVAESVLSGERVHDFIPAPGQAKASADASALLDAYPALAASQLFSRSLFDAAHESATLAFLDTDGAPESLVVDLQRRAEDLARLVHPSLLEEVVGHPAGYKYAWIADPDNLDRANDLMGPEGFDILGGREFYDMLGRIVYLDHKYMSRSGLADEIAAELPDRLSQVGNLVDSFRGLDESLANLEKDLEESLPELAGFVDSWRRESGRSYGDLYDPGTAAHLSRLLGERLTDAVQDNPSKRFDEIRDSLVTIRRKGAVVPSDLGPDWDVAELSRIRDRAQRPVDAFDSPDRYTREQAQQELNSAVAASQSLESYLRGETQKVPLPKPSKELTAAVYARRVAAGAAETPDPGGERNFPYGYESPGGDDDEYPYSFHPKGVAQEAKMLSLLLREAAVHRAKEESLATIRAEAQRAQEALDAAQLRQSQAEDTARREAARRDAGLVA